MRALRPRSNMQTLLGLCWLAACASHTEGKTEIHGGDCTSCHADEVQKTASPPHTLAGFVQNCGACHDEMAWQPAPHFVHTSTFPLTEGHANRQCTQCHDTSYVQGMIPNECVDCHGAEATKVPDPIHAGLDTNCFACHRTDKFAPAYFVHSWPLKGVHATLMCSSCHQGNPAVYEDTPPACVACHDADRARADATIQDHTGFPTTCEECHGFDKF